MRHYAALCGIMRHYVALCGTLVTTPMLYLWDNQALLKAVKRWIGEGGKAT